MQFSTLTPESLIDQAVLPAHVIEAAKKEGAKTVKDLLNLPIPLIIPAMANIEGFNTIGSIEVLTNLSMIYALSSTFIQDEFNRKHDGSYRI